MSVGISHVNSDASEMENDWEEDCPCKECEKEGHYCDVWDAQYCCRLCMWKNDGEPPWCDDCDPMDI